jgi:peptide methionine sulfoxide reductase MsrA
MSLLFVGSRTLACTSVAVAIVTLLGGCQGGLSQESPSNKAASTGHTVSLSDVTGDELQVSVYVGCGCFWHVQHELVKLEMSFFNREVETITARTAYAGGTQVGPEGAVCYHNFADVADYGDLGHTEVVSLVVPETSVGAVAEKFWEICPRGTRADPQDRGGEYRSAIGLPGGMKSPYLNLFQEGADGTTLSEGHGNEGDTIYQHRVYVYDTALFPAHTAEKYHQFHDDMIKGYGSSYHELQEYATKTSCPGDSKHFL